MVTVIQGTDTEIQPLSGSDGGGLAVFRQVVQRPSPYRQRIAVNATTADIADGSPVNPGIKTVNQAVVGQGLGCRYLRGTRADFSSGTVEQISGRQIQLIACLDQ